MPVRIVVDTNILVAALRSPAGINRQVIRACSEGSTVPVVGEKLYWEYESLLSRTALFETSPLSHVEREAFLDSFLAICHWVIVPLLWRPNLRDEGDNHILELALAGRASYIVTNNTRDFAESELRFPDVKIMTPHEFLRRP